ncbi:MAG: hypothetical protein ACFFG0_17925 [Candidatus Thorarchaeota archaeon]
MIKIEPQKEMWRSKSLYNGIILLSIYIIAFGFLIYSLVVPREYEIVEIDGKEYVKQKPIFTNEQLLWMAIFGVIYMFVIYGLTQRNEKVVMRDYSHMFVIKGPCHIRAKVGEQLDLWIDSMIPYPKLSEEEKIETMKFVKEMKITLIEFDNDKKLKQLIDESNKSFKEKMQKSFENKDETKILENKVEEDDDYLDDDEDDENYLNYDDEF